MIQGTEMIGQLREAVAKGKKFESQMAAGGWLQDTVGHTAPVMGLLRLVSVPSTASSVRLTGADEQRWKTLMAALRERNAAKAKAAAGLGAPGAPPPRRAATPKKPATPLLHDPREAGELSVAETAERKPATPKKRATSKKPAPRRVATPKRAPAAPAAARAAAEAVVKETILQAAKVVARGEAKGGKKRVRFEFTLTPQK